MNRQLLQDCLAELISREWDDAEVAQYGEYYGQKCGRCGADKPVSGEPGHRDNCEFIALVARLRSALATLTAAESGDPAAQILCLADRLEDMGDERAEVIRAAMGEKWKVKVAEWAMSQPLSEIGDAQISSSMPGESQRIFTNVLPWITPAQ